MLDSQNHKSFAKSYMSIELKTLPENFQSQRNGLNSTAQKLEWELSDELWFDSITDLQTNITLSASALKCGWFTCVAITTVS